MGKKTEKKRDLKLKHRAQAAKSGVLAKGTLSRKAAFKKKGDFDQILHNPNGTTGSSKAGFAPPKISAAKQLNAQRLKEKRDELRKTKVAKNRGLAAAARPQSLEELVGNANQSAASFEQKQKQETDTNGQFSLNDSSRKAYMKELRKVVDRADVILEVLDARDPMGCRTIDMEDAILARSGKKIVLVLNKIDLVPAHILQPWLTYLRTFYPTVAFKASTQHQGSRLSQSFGKADKASGEAISGSKAVGTEALMQLLKNYCRNSQLKTAITVGVIGYPNVGKSSVINSLKRSKAASVSSTAGHTKVMQEVHIDSKIKLLDCPGIVFDHSDSDALLLRNCVNTDTLADPVAAVEVVLSRCEKAQLVQLYTIPLFEDVIEFLVHLAKANGKLGKNGIPDRKAAARIVLQDWNRGKIAFFTPPPDTKKSILETQIVTNWSNEFDVDQVLNPTSVFLSEESTNQVDSMATAGPSCGIPVATASRSAAASVSAATSSATLQRQELLKGLQSDSDSDSDDDEEEDVDMDTGDHSTTGFQVKMPGSIESLTKKFEEDSLNPQSALLARRRAKAWRKLKRRTARQQIGESMETKFCEQLENVRVDHL